MRVLKGLQPGVNLALILMAVGCWSSPVPPAVGSNQDEAIRSKQIVSGGPAVALPEDHANGLERSETGDATNAIPQRIRFASKNGLKTAVVECGGNGDADVKEIVTHRDVNEIVLMETSISERALASIAELPALSTLNIMGATVTAASLMQLSENRHLQNLSITLTDVTDDELRRVTLSPNLRNLMLTQRTATITGKSIEYIVASCPDLESLTVSVAEIDDEQFSSLARLTRLNDLTVLGAEVSRKSLRHLISLQHLTTLRLRLARNEPDPDHAAISSLSKVTNLSFEGGRLTAEDLEVIGTLPKLTSLDISFSGATDDGVAHLERLQSLMYLNLDGTSITDSCLSRIDGIPKLKTLNISRTKVDGSGFEGLPFMLLSSLQLNQTKLSEDLAANLRQIRSLKFISLYLATIPETAVSTLVADHPEAVVHYVPQR